MPARARWRRAAAARPDSWEGILVRLLGKAHALQQLVGLRRRRRAVAREHLLLGQHDVFAGGHVRKQLEVLEHHADARAQLRAGWWRDRRPRCRRTVMAPFVNGSRREHLMSVLLPEPEGPQITTTSPLAMRMEQLSSTRNGPNHLLTFSSSITGRTFVADGWRAATR